MQPKRTKVMIADDQHIILDGLMALLSNYDDIEITGVASSGSEVLRELEIQKPDVLILDFNMPDYDGLEIITILREQNYSVKILLLTGYDDLSIVKEAFRRGANGFVLKNANKDMLCKAISDVMENKRYIDPELKEKLVDSAILNEPQSSKKYTSPSQNTPIPLTQRETEVLKLIVAGRKSSQIASELFISLNTVETHRRNLLGKCGVSNAAELVRFALEHNL